MIEPQIPPDRITNQPENMGNESQIQHPINVYGIEDFNWLRIFGFIMFMILVVIVGWILISDGGEFIASIVSNVTDWYDQATIDPHDTEGFAGFIRLILTALILALILYWLEKI